MKGDLRKVPSSGRYANCVSEFVEGWGMNCRRLRRRWRKVEIVGLLGKYGGF